MQSIWLRFIAGALGLCLLASAAGAANTGSELELQLEHAGQTRYYRVHLPPQLKSGQPLPLVVALHGGGGHRGIMADPRWYGLSPKADQAGFIVAYPNGLSRWPGGQFATWNAGNCCGAARDQAVDDVGFIRAMVAAIAQRWPVDRQRVFATGMSNGAMLAYRLACEAPDVFRAIAAIAGTDNTRSCPPGRAVSVLHIHALDDERVLFNGGAGRQDGLREQVTDFTSVPATLTRWTQRLACPEQGRVVLQQAGAQCTQYAPCQSGSEVQLCTTATGGHSWPGGQSPRKGKADPSQAISATDLLWAFFQRQSEH
ncbi:PHB depolymerase family esterase [Chitinibacter sp. ZOR0017]|uniref:extracellular catalytic domain type 1 short-chain-length polyhydroxyalkanoate depolymerase n=1 Tax=Chitinibacter sp. ZOR0017 TaxID=1339254 RepID=UPI00068CC3B6|nr:PHB depolymerase family esterase [Chitinibacter sp. ZOR0017]